MCNPLFERQEEEKKEYEPLFPGDSEEFSKQDAERWRKTGESAYGDEDGSYFH